MSPLFGIYTTIVGLAAVLLILSAVIISCKMLRRVLIRGVDASGRDWRGEDMKLAAAVSAIYWMLAEEAPIPKVTPAPKMTASEASIWPIIARLDSLRTFQEGGP